jgi:hypothetical protein
VTWVLGAGLALAVPACKDSTGPTPVPTSKPAVPFPPGTPQATALENLALVRNLEAKASAKAMILIGMGTYSAATTGRLMAGNHGPWAYSFAEAVGDNPNYDEWDVWPDGRVEFHGNFAPIGPASGYIELQPIQIDSDRAAALALEYGAQRYEDKYPGSTLQMICSWRSGRRVWHVTASNSQLAGPICADEVFLDANTGELLTHIPSTCL